MSVETPTRNLFVNMTQFQSPLQEEGHYVIEQISKLWTFDSM